MDWPFKLLFIAAFFVTVATNGANGDASVTGSVFCDQCKDGHVTLFDYPLSGIRVGITCLDDNGQVAFQAEETTNWLGSYSMRFNGAPDLRGCQVQVLGPSQGPIDCGAVAGPAQRLKLLFTMFGMEMYNVDPLLSQPAQPMSICPKSGSPVSVPAPPVTTRPPPSVPVQVPPSPTRPPPIITSPPPPSVPVQAPPVTIRPHPPPAPLLPPVPIPSLEASACPYWKWRMPEYKCYWKIVNPDTKVGLAFGVIAARRYGTDMTLSEGMRGKGEAYRTLLREATTALLNSYSTFQFQYHPLGVIQDFNLALMGSKEQLLFTALRFKRANSGYGKLGCKFTPCK